MARRGDVASAVSDAVKAQQRFLACAAHELRGAITLEVSLAEAALADPNADSVVLRQMGEGIVAACWWQERLREALLMLARSEHEQLRREPVDLAATVAGVLRAHDHHELTRTTALEPACTFGEPQLIERLGGNLIGTPSDTTFSAALALRSCKRSPTPHDATLTAHARTGGGLVIEVSFPALEGKEPNIMRGRLFLTCGAALAAASLLMNGCGGGSTAGSPNSSDGTPQGQASTQVLGYAMCMRSHGVAGYPDPVVSGSGNSVKVTMSPGSANPDSPTFRSADRACHHILPNGGEQGGAGGSSAQQVAQDGLFADCMRSHGVPSFPDPDHDGVFTLSATISEQAPAFLRAIDACQKAQPTSLSIDQHT